MSLPRFFLSEQILAHETDDVFDLRLDADDMKHAQVLRLKSGEHLAIIDAAHDYFEVEITDISRSEIRVRIAQHLEQDAKLPHLTLVQGFAKGDKMDLVVRHATEVGITAFVPFLSERSIVKLDRKRTDSKVARWQTIAKSAAMQAGRSCIPHIETPCKINGLNELLSQADLVLVCWEEAEQTARLRDAVDCVFEQYGGDQSDLQVVLVVGPEGGLSQQEVNALLEVNSHAYLITLGSSILRTETAGIVAPALVLYEFASRH